MSEEENNSEFNEKFETIEDTLKYIADTQAKMEWMSKKNQIERKKFEEKRLRFEENMQKLEEESRRQQLQTQKQLDYITKLTGIAFEDIMFQEDKLQEAGDSLQKKK